MIKLHGKTALITGAGRGIGKAIAEKLAHAGVNLGIADIDLSIAQETAAAIRAIGPAAIPIQVDVSKSDSVSAMVNSFIGEFGTIDILVNNAGITRDGLFLRMKEQDWDSVINVNLKSIFLCCKEVCRPMLKASKGKIINIASVVGIIGNIGQANYSASKAGVIGLTKTLAREFASRTITVNAIAPGFIESAMTDKLPELERSKYIDQIPLKRFGKPEDIANTALFLSSDLSDYITGQVFVVDGGLAM